MAPPPIIPQNPFEVNTEMNTDRTLPEKVAAGDETWVRLAPWGTHRIWDEEKKTWVGQRLDEAAGSQLVRAFSGDILVDADHSSENGGSTEALAWIAGLDARDDGLWALFRWTDKGAEAVSGRRYRFVSPAWTVDDDGRPDLLVSCALTNRPNIPSSKPILNSAAGGSGEPTRKPQMEELKKALGLAPDAADADVLAAVQALQAENASLKEAKLNSEAEAFAEEHKDKCDREVLKNSYRKDPELAKKLVLNMKAPAKAPETPRKPVCNSAAAKAPDLSRDRPLSDRLRGMTPEQACAELLKD